MKPKILITDDEVYVDNIMDELTTVADVRRCENTLETTLTNAVQNVDLVIVSCFTKIPAAVFDNASRLKAILKYGVGVDNIDLEAATRNRVLVVNCPEYGSDTIAEHAFALILGLARKLVKIDRVMRGKGWIQPSAEFMGTDLLGKTIGLIGFGRIGQSMARKAGSFGMRIMVHDPYVSPDPAKDFKAKFVTLDELLRTADVISIHCILTSETQKLFGTAEFKKMKKTAFLIDVSRGEIIDEKALLTALRENWIAGAGLDVFAHEPLKPDHPLLEMENVILTPHLAWYTREASKRLEQETLERALEILAGKIPRNVKNPAVLKKI